MNLTYELIKQQINKLHGRVCRNAGAVDDGHKFSLLMLKKMSGLKGYKLYKSFTEGGGDHQLDAVYFGESDDLEINILTCKFIQNSKSTISTKDVQDFIQCGVPYLLFGDAQGADFNEKVESLKDDIAALKDDHNQDYSVSLKFISTADTPLCTNGRNIIQKAINSWNQAGVNVDYEEIGSKQLSSMFSHRKVLSTPMRIKLSGTAYYQLTGREGFVCRLPVSEIINIYNGYTDEEGREYPGYGDFIFSDNVRRSLGIEKKINKAIYETASNPEYAEDFEYFNNGITVIYDEKKGGLTKDSPIITIKGMQIVNGCQTVSTLIKANDQGLLNDDIYLNCRFIQRTDDEQFVRSVIKYTNSQNAISDRDLHANDGVQYDIQGIFLNFGIFYERKLNEYKDENDDRRIDALDAAQAYLCCELEKPKLARTDKRKIFSDLYFEIFDAKNKDLAYQLFLSYRTLEFAFDKQYFRRKKKRQKKGGGRAPRTTMKDRIVSYGSYHIASIIYRKYFKGTDSVKLQGSCKTFNFHDKFEKYYPEVLDNLEKKLKQLQIKNEDIQSFFKRKELNEF